MTQGGHDDSTHESTDDDGTRLEAGIVTHDVDALARFYVDGMGFTVLSDMTFPQGRVCRLRRGGAAVKLFAPTDETQPRPHSGLWHALRGFAYAALNVADADHTVARAVAAGATVLHPVTAHRPGARYALVADPQGNVWEILEESSPAQARWVSRSSPTDS